MKTPLNSISNFFLIRSTIILLCFLFIHSISYTQVFFSTRAGLGASLGEVTINNCDFNLKGYSKTFSDITLHPNGKLYGLISINNSSALVELNLKKEIFVDTLVYIGGFGATSLTCNKEGIFYLGHSHLYSYNADTDSLSNLGIFPNEQALAGDLVFFDGQLFGGTYDFFHNDFFGYIYKFNVEDLFQSERVFQFSSEKQFCVALTIIRDNFQNEFSLIAGSNKISNEEADVSFLHQINLTDSSSIELCRSELIGGDITGLASADELRTNYQLQLDLDTDNSSGRYIDHYEHNTRCTYDYPIADEDISIISTHPSIDSMVIVIEEGVLHQGQEILTGEVANNLLALSGDQSSQLTYRNLGTATETDFITALSSVRFRIIEENPLPGEREVRIYLYANGEVSDGSRAFLIVNFIPATAGEDGYVEICSGGGGNGTGLAAHLFLSLGGTPDEGGIWHPETFYGDGVLNINIDTSGIYQYIVQEGVCAADTAEVEFYRIPDPDVSLGTNENGQIFLCQGDSLVWDISIPNAGQYSWDTGTEGPIQIVHEAGLYFAEVRDSMGCATQLEAQVIMLPDSNRHSGESYVLCAGDSYEWQGQAMTSDTILCEHYALVSGCDSIHCVDLQFLPSYDLLETLSFCHPDTFWWEGQAIVQDTLLCWETLTTAGCDSTTCYDLQFFEAFSFTESHVFVCGQTAYEVGGVSFEQDTSFCFYGQTAAGCDSIRCIVAEILPIPTTDLALDLCLGDTLLVGNELITAGGVYDILLEGQAACDSNIHLVVNILPTYEQTIDTVLLEGEQIVIGEAVFSTTGEYIIPLRTVDNCDSTIFLNLMLLNSTTDLTVRADDFYATSLLHLQGEESFKVFSTNQAAANIQSMRVFDLWGRAVFNQKEMQQEIATFEWSPQINGHILIAGVYWYQIELEDQWGVSFLLVGKMVVV